MIYFIAYILGMALTLFVGVWYLSIIRYKLYCDDIEFLLFVALFFPIAVPIVFIFLLPRLLHKPANFIFKKVKKWRKKHENR